MKYIYSILCFALVVSILFLFSILNKNVQDEDYALKINDRQISIDEFELQYSMRISNELDKSAFADSLVLKELLIQEAQRAGVDREEAFRKSIQNFYEQSLSKILLDRKFAEIEVQVTPDEIDRYMNLVDAEISITLIPHDSPLLAGEILEESNETVKNISDKFENFSTDIKMVIFPLDVAEKSSTVDIYDGKYILRLDSVVKNTNLPPSKVTRTKVEKLILEFKKEKQIQMWLDSLRMNANVQVNEKNL